MFRRWPFATKVELIDGSPHWVTEGGPWDERDIEAAERTFPGWLALLSEEGHVMTLRPKPPLPADLLADAVRGGQLTPSSMPPGPPPATEPVTTLEELLDELRQDRDKR